jgi:hypothetical protein
LFSSCYMHSRQTSAVHKTHTHTHTHTHTTHTHIHVCFYVYTRALTHA